MPLPEYASLYWAKHTRIATTKNAKPLALRPPDRLDNDISAQLLLWYYNEDRGRGLYFKGGGPSGFTGLHGASYLGVADLVAGVLEMKERMSMQLIT